MTAHVEVKIFAREPITIDLGDAIPVFHRWIQNQVCEELLIDVADYRHLPAGPGVILVAHEAIYSLDSGANRLGLLYRRRKPYNGAPEENIERALRSALRACQLLEDEEPFRGKLKFDAGNCEIRLSDRLLAPNTPETFAEITPHIVQAFETLWGPGACSVERLGEPRELVRIAVRRCAAAS